MLEIKKIGDEYFTFITDCKDPKACTILLRGASKELLSVSLPWGRARRNWVIVSFFLSF